MMYKDFNIVFKHLKLIVLHDLYLLNMSMVFG